MAHDYFKFATKSAYHTSYVTISWVSSSWTDQIHVSSCCPNVNMQAVKDKLNGSPYYCAIL